MAVGGTQTLCAGAGIQSQLFGIRCPWLTSAVRNYCGAWPWQVRGHCEEENKSFSSLFCPCLPHLQYWANVVLIQEEKCHLQSHSEKEGWGKGREKKKPTNKNPNQTIGLQFVKIFLTVKLNWKVLTADWWASGGGREPGSAGVRLQCSWNAMNFLAVPNSI